MVVVATISAQGRMIKNDSDRKGKKTVILSFPNFLSKPENTYLRSLI